MNNRRRLVLALGGAVAVPRDVFAQAKKPPVVIGWLCLRSRESAGHQLGAFKEELAALGWREGLHMVIEERWSDGRADRLPSLVKELAAIKPAVIVADGVRAASDAANWAPNIPIVMVAGTDPVTAGLVTSLARPGGIVTGVTGLSIDLAAKRLELLLAAVPKMKRVGFLGYSRNPNQAKLLETVRRSVAKHSVEARFAEVAIAEEIEPALSRLSTEGVQGLVLLTGALLTEERQRILKFALAHRWPMVWGAGSARDGALIGYSPDILAQFRRAAYYVDRILKGTKPGDLPIEQPMTFELVVNLKTAKALGLNMPPEIMVQATRVIQ